MTLIQFGKSNYLRNETFGIYHAEYRGMRYYQENPQCNDSLLCVNMVKNDTYDCPAEYLPAWENMITNIVLGDFIEIAEYDPGITVCGVPRSKRDAHYSHVQRGLKRAFRAAVGMMNGRLVDGLDYIMRHTDTCTTHRMTRYGNYGGSGESPRPGLINDTCTISPLVRGREIVLVDDIYTPGVGIDEDCIQALYDHGAKEVLFYAIGKARGNGQGFRFV